MARRNRDLAGLAALGALGLYMGRGGKKTAAEAAATPVEDRKAAAAPLGVGMLRGSVEEETAGTNLPRLNEYGEPYSLEAAPARPAATRPAATTNRSMAGSKVPEEVPSRGRRELPARRNVAGDYTRAKGATAEEIAAYRNREINPPPMTPEMRRQADQQALERVTPEEYLIGGPGLKAMHAAAKNLARPRQLLLPAPAARPPVRGTGEGFVMYKKGGAVKAKKMASGGFTSASSRADGIASRGKTKCKMY